MTSHCLLLNLRKCNFGFRFEFALTVHFVKFLFFGGSALFLSYSVRAMASSSRSLTSNLSCWLICRTGPEHFSYVYLYYNPNVTQGS